MMDDLSTKSTGSLLTAIEWNEVPKEIQNVITSAGETLSGSDLHQLSKAVQTYASDGDFYTGAGTANAITLTTVSPRQSPSTITNGMRVRWVAAATNTGATTLNLSGISTKNLKLPGAFALPAGMIKVGNSYEAIYHSSGDFWELQDSLSNKLDINNAAATTIFIDSSNHMDYINISNATPVTVSVDAAIAPFGDVVTLEKLSGSGLVSFIGDSGAGVTVEPVYGSVPFMQYDGQIARLYSKATNKWKLEVVGSNGYIDFHVSSNGTSINLKTLYEAMFPAAVSGQKVRIYINSGLTIGATNTSTPAIRTGVWASGVEVTVINKNTSNRGAGGNGAVGTSGTAGGNGGDCLLVESAIYLDNQGTFGGGGGGGGASNGSSPYCEGGGGGGAGNPVGTAGASSNYTGGTLAASGTGTTGGVGADVYYTSGITNYHSTGGNGGNLGAGGAAATSSGSPWVGTNGGASAAGASINGVSLVTFINVGTLLGPQIN
jgi:hypothetical protein